MSVSTMARPRTRLRPRRQGSEIANRAGPFTYLLLILTALAFVMPFYYMIVAGSRPMSEMAQSPPPLTPGPELWSNIQKALDQQNIGLAIVNSTIVSSAITAGTVLFCTSAGFAFAKLRFRGRNALFAFTIGTMMIPPALGVVPLYTMMTEYDLAGTLTSVILPTLVTAFGVFFMRQYVSQALPDELLDAAKVDGASS
ncbi:MAG: carbohydrate ABC transporter permease, partial [Actinomycetia bacterium]|nr:carbohydrate ABC transporter permease [Actinomycetes bacterium]